MGERTPTSSFTPREIAGAPSSERTAFFKARYLQAPLMVDIEYIRLLTESHRRTDGMEILERRAEDHAHALEALTPVIHARDRIAGNKTRFIRGAIPYANYAAGPFLREIGKEEQDAQQSLAEQGTGGGIALAHERASQEGLSVLSGKFLISPADLTEFTAICEYWDDKCMMGVGDRLWKREFPEAPFIEAGWEVGLYTAPHDPCPEGRLILDFETAVGKGYDAVLQEIRDRISAFVPASIRDAQKLHFWRAARRVLEGSLRFAENYAEEAERLAQSEADPVRKGELLEMADICRRVPAHPPRNFREAVQSFWFTYLLGHMEGSHLGYSPGRLDQVLFPYYRGGRSASTRPWSSSKSSSSKMTQIEYIASLSWQGLGHGNLYQNCILGGLDEHGNPADNEISLAILQAQINMQMTQPTLSVWYDDAPLRRVPAEGRGVREDGRGLPGLLQPEDLRGPRAEDERPSRGDHPEERGHGRLHGADPPGHVLRRRPGGLREPRQAPRPDPERRRGPGHGDPPLRPPAGGLVRGRGGLLPGQDARGGAELAAVLELRHGRPPRHGAPRVLLGLRAGLPRAGPVHGRRRGAS